MVYAVGSLIIAQDIIDRFATVVVATANSGIVWYLGNSPSPAGYQLIPDSALDAGSGGIPIPITGSNLTNPISASQIYNTLVNTTNSYTRLRNARAILFVLGGGGKRPAGPLSPAGTYYDQTSKTNMSSGYLQTASATQTIAAGQVITLVGLNNQMTNLQNAYVAAQNTTAGPFQTNVCHGSCHSSCHGSRGRR